MAILLGLINHILAASKVTELAAAHTVTTGCDFKHLMGKGTFRSHTSVPP
ncbi:hypothetical protein [Paenibacillus sp. FSL L8-0463]